MTKWDDWLRALAADQRGGQSVGLPVADRGLEWSTPVELDGDWTGAILAGYVRLEPGATSPLVTMTLSGGDYSADTGLTVWTASLAAGSGSNSTGALPPNEFGNGVLQFPCAFHLTPSGGSEGLLFGCLFTLRDLV